MFCEDCEEELKETDKVCQICGKKVKRPYDKKKYLVVLALIPLIGGSVTAGIISYKKNHETNNKLANVSSLDSSDTTASVIESETTNTLKDEKKSQSKNTNTEKLKDESKETNGSNKDSKIKTKDEKEENKLVQNGDEKQIKLNKQSQDEKNNPIEKVEIKNIKEILDNSIKESSGLNSYYFEDITENKYFNFNNKQQLAAGMINLFIMQMVFDQVESEKLNLTDTYKLTASDCTSGTGVIKTMSVGSEFTLDQLVKHMMVDSDNTATNVLINKLGGIEKIQNYLKEKNYKDTHINRKMADMGAISSGKENYTSVNDVGTLLSKVYKHELVSDDMDNKMLDYLSLNKDKAKLRKNLPEDLKVYSNSGQFSNYGVMNDSLIMTTKDKTFVVVVLMQKGEQHTQLSVLNKIGENLNKEIMTK